MGCQSKQWSVIHIVKEAGGHKAQWLGIKARLPWFVDQLCHSHNHGGVAQTSGVSNFAEWGGQQWHQFGRLTLWIEWRIVY